MWKAALALVLMLLVPGAQACQQVAPILDLEFPDKPACREVADCDPLPAHGESKEYEGTLHFSWDIDQCTAQNGLPGEPATVEFGAASSMPSWLRMRVEPEEMVISTQDQLDPRNMHIEDPTGNPRIYFQVDRGLSVTFTRVGAPGEVDLQRIEARDGMLATFLKAQSESSTSDYTAFGVEEFRFDARSAIEGGIEGEPMDAPAQEASWPLPVTALALLGALLVARRR